MARKTTNVPAKSGYVDTRFNATTHGILSRHTVLPWEDAEEYRELYEDLIAEYAPLGPTEGHLVEELAGIMWRKQRLRMAEAGAARDSLGLTATERGRPAKSPYTSFYIIETEEAAIDEDLLSLIAVQPDKAEDKLKKIKNQLSKDNVENREDLERQRDFLMRYREVHEAAQSNVAAGSGLEKLARYETHLDRKFERMLTMLLRIQEFRNRAVAVDPNTIT